MSASEVLTINSERTALVSSFGKLNCEGKSYNTFKTLNDFDTYHTDKHQANSSNIITSPDSPSIIAGSSDMAKDISNYRGDKNAVVVVIDPEKEPVIVKKPVGLAPSQQS